MYFRLLKTMSKHSVLHQIIIRKFDKFVRPERDQTWSIHLLEHFRC